MWRTWVRVLAVGGAALLAVLLAFQRLPGLEELSWASGAASFVLTVVAVVLAWPRTPTSPTLPVPEWVRMAVPARQANTRDLGVHEALSGPEGERLPPYVVRDVDAELDRRLEAAAASPRGGLVLVAGASTAGKTRALAQALARTLPERMLISPPEGTDLAPLPAWLKKSSKRARQGWVVWLDDLDRHLAAANLTPALVAELGQAGAVVAATIRSQRLQDLRPSATDHGPAVEGVGYAVLKPPPLTLAREWSPPERERARTSGDERLVRAADDERFGVAEQLAAGPYLQQIWESGPDSGHPRGYALVAAAVGLAQAGLASPLTREQLHTAHTAYLPAPPPLPEEADRAWAWATQPRSGLAGLLVPADHQGHRWRAFDYFTTQDRLPDAVWHTALDAATDQDRFNVGVTAYRAEQIDIAERAWHPLAKQGDTEAMVGLGVLLKDTGRGEEAKAWFRKAAKQGDADAMVQFGALLQDTGRGEEAKAWFRKAAKQGHIRAMVILGLLLFYEARVEEVKAWLRKNPDADHTDVLAGHEALLADTGQADTGQLLEEAERWFRQAAENGNTSAMFNLGDLLEATGRGEEAEDWRQQAREIEGPE